MREGNLEAPTRHPLDWKNPEFYDQEALFHEMERVFDVCHGCRRCVSLCGSFPTLFDLVDASATMEVDGVAKEDYWKVVDQCYLCDVCYVAKCPYVPPHPWNLDFPHLMLRAKAVKHEQGLNGIRDRVLSSTDTLGMFAGIPIVTQTVNAVNKTRLAREVMEMTLGVDENAWVPEYASKKFRSGPKKGAEVAIRNGERTPGKVAIFSTCYINYNEPGIGHDLVALLEHNGIAWTLAEKEACCGMPKLELGDLKAVEALKNKNIPPLLELARDGYAIVTPIPSCTLMFKQELPLMFPGDAEVLKVKKAIFDPFEYLLLRHKGGKLNTDFKTALGKISYHVACHLRVQNIGLKTRDLLQLVPGTHIEAIERCSGHNGTYAVKQEFHDFSMKIGKPVVQRVQQAVPDHYSSDCPMAGHQIENGLKNGKVPEHPLALLRLAYGIER